MRFIHNLTAGLCSEMCNNLICKVAYINPCSLVKGNFSVKVDSCGFETVSDIPSEATFSRAFEEFSKRGFGERVHEALVEKKQAEG
jgi:hypothetical protein